MFNSSPYLRTSALGSKLGGRFGAPRPRLAGCVWSGCRHSSSGDDWQPFDAPEGGCQLCLRKPLDVTSRLTLLSYCCQTAGSARNRRPRKALTCGFGGQGRGRTADLPIFRCRRPGEPVCRSAAGCRLWAPQVQFQLVASGRVAVSAAVTRSEALVAECGVARLTWSAWWPSRGGSPLRPELQALASARRDRAYDPPSASVERQAPSHRLLYFRAVLHVPLILRFSGTHEPHVREPLRCGVRYLVQHLARNARLRASVSHAELALLRARCAGCSLIPMRAYRALLAM